MIMSRKNYVTIAEAEAITGITLTDAEISQAEDQIDSYVGRVGSKHLTNELVGNAQAGGASTITLADSELSIYYAGHFVGMQVEIIGGQGMGQRRNIQSHAGDVLTVDAAWDEGKVPDNTSVYHVFQAGKFPRGNDVVSHDGVDYPGIPEAVKNATAYQAVWMKNLGDELDNETLASENIGGYSYSSNAKAGSARIIAPKARVALRGYVNRVGQFS
jgi:hypothetical protein